MTPLVGRVQQAAGVLQRSLYGQTGPAVLSSVARSFASEAESNGIPVEVQTARMLPALQPHDQRDLTAV